MSEDLITNTKWKSIPEREREALMRLTMCAREECPMCKYEEQCDNWDFRMELATKNMNILADALRAEQTEPQTIRCPKCGRSDYIREFGKDFSVTAEEAGFKYKCINCNTYIEPQSDRKTENSSEKPNNCEPQTEVETMSCAECKHRPIGAEICEEACHYEPQTDWHYDEQDATWYPYKHEDEPQQKSCATCKHALGNWDGESNNCGRCCGADRRFYEPKDEPQTERRE